MGVVGVVMGLYIWNGYTDIQTYRLTDIQTYRHTDIHTDLTDRQTDRQHYIIVRCRITVLMSR